jgi:hypothetical protein
MSILKLVTKALRSLTTPFVSTVGTLGSLPAPKSLTGAFIESVADSSPIQELYTWTVADEVAFLRKQLTVATKHRREANNAAIKRMNNDRLIHDGVADLAAYFSTPLFGSRFGVAS